MLDVGEFLVLQEQSDVVVGWWETCPGQENDGCGLLNFLTVVLNDERETTSAVVLRNPSARAQKWCSFVTNARRFHTGLTILQKVVRKRDD